MGDYQESVTTGQTDIQTHRQTDARQKDPYVTLCFAGYTKMNPIDFQGQRSRSKWTYRNQPCEKEIEHIVECEYIVQIIGTGCLML